MLVERCRYLEQSGCASVCLNSCKVPTQASSPEGPERKEGLKGLPEEGPEERGFAFIPRLLSMSMKGVGNAASFPLCLAFLVFV